MVCNWIDSYPALHRNLKHRRKKNIQNQNFAVAEFVNMLPPTFPMSLTSLMPAKLSLAFSSRHIVPSDGGNGLYAGRISPSRASIKWRCYSLPNSYDGQCSLFFFVVLFQVPTQCNVNSSFEANGDLNVLDLWWQ